jgi:hypothetical protein
MHNDRNHEEAMSSRDALLIVEKIGAWSTGELAHLYISSQLPVRLAQPRGAKSYTNTAHW